MPPLLLAFLSFSSIAAIAVGASQILTRRQARPMEDRLAALAGEGEEIAAVSVLNDRDEETPFRRLLVVLGRRLESSKDDVERDVDVDEQQQKRPAKGTVTTRELLVQAGFRRPSAHQAFLGLRVALALGIITFGMLLSALVSPAFMGISFCFAGTGYALPGVLLARLAAARRDTVRQTLPDTLDLLLLCVEAGLGLNAALQRVAEERLATNPTDPLGEELSITTKELQVGLARREALRNLAARTGSEDVRQLAVQIIQSEKLGSSVSQTLRVMADSIRTARRLEAEEQANKVQIKLLFPLILFIFPTVMIVILFPAGSRLVAALGTLM